jgi:cathepsin L
MRTFAVASLLTTAGAATFEAFVQFHGRSYTKGTAEYKMRQELFHERLAAVEAHNAQEQRLWTAGVNKLADWTESELLALRGWDGSVRPSATGHVRPHRAFLQQDDEDSTEDLPAAKAWDVSATRNIRNQGDCGSCWAIASATVLEAHAEIYGHPRTFSAQQIVECTPNPRSCGGNGGCGGATAELAMDWVMKNTVAQEDELPYTGQDAKCKSVLDSNPSLAMTQLFGAPSSAAGFGMTGWETLPKNSYEPLVRALAQKGPVAVSVAADSWFNYESGIFNGCGKDAVIDHAVTAIGYGQDVDTKYWVIQNSWGSDWGEAGHIRLERHPDGQYCGMNNDPQKGVACQGENDPVPVCGMCGVLFDSVVPHFQK